MQKTNRLIIWVPLITIVLTYAINRNSFFEDSYIDIDKEPVAPEISQSEALAAIQSLEQVGKTKYNRVWTDYEDEGVSDFNPVFFDLFENDFEDSYFINYYFDETGAISDSYFSYHYGTNDSKFIISNLQEFLTYSSTDLETAVIKKPVSDFKPLYVIDQAFIDTINNNPKQCASLSNTKTIENLTYETNWTYNSYDEDIACINYEIHF